MRFLRRALASLSLVAVASCGEDSVLDQISLPWERDEQRLEAPRPTATEIVDEERFALIRTETNTDGAQPAFCLVFNEALNPRQDYEPFVAIDRQVALSVSGQSLCLEGLRYADETSLTLRAGLPSRSGETLATDETVNISFADRPAVVSFAGNGVVLPKSGGDGLAVTTVNVPAVSVTVDRLNDRALVLKRITEGYSAQAGTWRYAPYDERPEQFGARVFEGVLETEGPANTATVTTLPIRKAVRELEPGAYYVQIRDARAEDQALRNPARAARWIVVTDLAMTAYRSGSGLDVTVRSLQSAEPVGRAEVALISNANEVLATERAGTDGRVRFPAAITRGEGADGPRLLTVTTRNDFAILDLSRAPLDLSAQPVDGRQPREIASAYVYLDRGVYRPGEDVHASVLFRDPQGIALDDRPGALVLYRPNGTEQARRRFRRFDEASAVLSTLRLPDTATRGVWQISAELDGLGEVGSVSLNVEDFVPQRLALTLDANTDDPIDARETRVISANLRFLYGAPGAGLTVDGEARIEADPSPFSAFPGFRYGMAREPFRQEVIRLLPSITDGAGNASLALSPRQRGEQATMPLRLRTVISAAEPGGRAIRDDLRIPYRPRALYVGLKPGFEGSAERGAPIAFETMLIDRLGALSDGTVDWRLRRRDYDYDWYRTEGGIWRWRRSERIVTVLEGSVATTRDAPTSIELPPQPWGDYELVASFDGEDLTSTTFWVGYGGRSADGTPAPDSVRVLPPSDPVAVGGEATVAIDAPYPGIAEVAVATGEILSLQHIVVPEGGTEITVPVTDAWGAGAYVLVSVYTDRDPDSRPVPRRAVGAAFVPVDTSDRRLHLMLDVPEIARPNTEQKVALRLANAPSEKVYATLAAVDEGILLLTRHQSPDPEAAFLSKAALTVDLYDDYGRILDPNQAEPGRLRSGGDAIGGAGLTVVPTKSVALFRGPIALDRDGNAEVTMTLPDFNGELRLMAVVWSETGVGSASTPLTVRDPVPAEVILPRFLAPGDEAIATLTIDNVEGAPGTYNAGLTSSASSIQVPETVIDVSLRRGERSDRPLSIKADSEGIAELGLNVEGPDNFAAESTYPIQVRGAYLPQTDYRRLTLNPGESFAPGADAFRSLVPGSETMRVSVSTTPIDVSGLSALLTTYPYACTEQLVSRATPLLLKNDRSPEETQALQADIDALLERQSPDGAFGMWRVSDRQASPWLGAYATDFIARSKEQGLRVPDQALTRAYQALQPISQGEVRRAYGYNYRWADGPFSADTFELLSQRSSAYALYVLTRGGVVDRSRLRYVHDTQLNTINSPLARAQIGAALAALGDRGRAANAFAAAAAVSAYRNPGDWYQSVARDMAGRAELLAEAGETEAAGDLLVQVAERLPEPERMRTQDKAFLIRAADALEAGNRTPTITRGDERIGEITLTRNDNLDLPFENTSRRPLFVSVLTEGTPALAPPPASSALALSKRITSTDGSPVDLATVRQGDRLIIALTVTPQRRARSQYVITDLLPAGFEIETVLGPAEAAPRGPYAFLGQVIRPDIAEARDDRFVASSILGGNASRTIAYVVRAVTPGSFTAPGGVAEDMYDPTVFARTVSGAVVISP